MNKQEFTLRALNDSEFNCVAHLRCIPQLRNVDGFNSYGYLIIKTLNTSEDEIKDIPCTFCGV